jgi:hypothetical protein
MNADLQQFVLHVNDLGELVFVWADELADLCGLGDVWVARASHVEPVANGGGWTADLSPIGGPLLGPFPLRGDALAAEREWLDRNLPLEERTQ